MAALEFNMLVRKACKSFGNIGLRLPTGQVKIQANMFSASLGKLRTLQHIVPFNQMMLLSDYFDPCSSILCLMRT